MVLFKFFLLYYHVGSIFKEILTIGYNNINTRFEVPFKPGAPSTPGSPLGPGGPGLPIFDSNPMS